MGKGFAGKTSMKSIIFANYMPKGTSRLHPTIQIAHTTQRLLGDLRLDLWDCGGQDVFMRNYFKSQRGIVFRNVAVLIYVFDVQSLQNYTNGTIPEDLYDFNTALGAIRQQSPNAKIFCLIHKMDTIMPLQRKHQIFSFHAHQLQKEAKTFDLNITCFATSIWDETLFKAWSEIVRSLIPNEGEIQSELQSLCLKSQADEIVLLEKRTLLFIANATSSTRELSDQFRHERIANIIKIFKLKCNKARYLLNEMTVQNAKFTAYIGPFTKSTMILAVTSNDENHIGAVTMNLERSKDTFEELMMLQVGGGGSANRTKKLRDLFF